MLIDYLDKAIARVGQAQARHVQTATRTDQGPTRQRNEDACYPPSGTVQTLLSAEDPLVVVCDGIGGHQGGDVASNLAIEAIQHQIASPGSQKLQCCHFDGGARKSRLPCQRSDQPSE
ncbi:MAG: hypothetical protein HC781_04395 [Leptolyngbyaceae cyanobacterium CSU_1_4]|nr:hypothetical protein [Leptolyngbyaceae cyanobacterium CSU_1_4]